MLGNKRKDFVHEISVVIISMVTFTILTVYFADIYPHNTQYSVVNDFIVIFFASFFIFFPIIRVIRYAYVYRAYILLYFPYLYFIPTILFIGLDSFQNLQRNFIENVGHLISFVIILTSMFVYTEFIYVEKKRGLFRESAPPERIAMVRSILTSKEKLTLVFPDQYIKYLETGDKRFLRDDGDGERKE